MARPQSRRMPVLDARWVTFGGLVVFVAAAVLLTRGVPADPSADLDFGDAHVVEVTGSEHAWHMRYAGPDGVLGSADDIQRDGDLHLPQGVPTRLVLRSTDFVYTLRVTDLGLDDVALPDMPGELTVPSPAAGTYALQGGQICGVGYPGLQGHVVVHAGMDYWAALRRGAGR